MAFSKFCPNNQFYQFQFRAYEKRQFDVTSRFDDFLRQYEILSLELSISKNCNRFLAERIAQLVNNAQ